ncbi:DNA mismatch repair protein [Phytophthora fragariae]|nr:DNA mismatch repair protein [Phytophthora fragariae]KAE9003046.1 DNA mismatch repair protein [Phytophthora fragariae]KAE9103591.1 DNA mismatch repair protein [Phytophthora fragariae]KAE9103740.1 DNA mismatch repair protein [Phytophthora fragariae]KAE9254020.1 DNA mismatch repair protein [Phytophthora fragariae]
MDQVAPASRVELDEGAVRPPRYGVPVPERAETIAKGAASRNNLSSSRAGSRGSTTTENESRSSFLIAAVAENRAREIGICAIDLVSPYELLLWTVIDSHSYVDTMSLLQAYQPVEILVVETSKSRKINDEIAKRFSGSNCRVVPLARKYFDQTKGAEDIKRVMANNVDINIGRNYVAMASVACVMKYIEYIQGVYIAEKTMKVVLSPSTRKLLMDHATVSALELVQGTRGRNDSQSLSRMLNNTQTSAGNRLLRSTMLQPTCHLKTIQARQEVVGIFLDNPAWFFDVMEELRDFVDLDRLLSQLVFVPKVITPRVSRIAIGSVIALKHTLECLPKLVSCLETTSVQLDRPCPLLDSIIQSLRDEQFTGIKADIERVVNDRVKVCRSAARKRIQECFAVRAGVDGMLDVARRTYLDTIEKIHEVVHTYKENLGIPIRLNYTSRRGYHLAVPVNCNDLSACFIERVATKSVICCSTKALVSLNVRLNEALTAVYKLSNDVIQQLLDKIRPRASTMHAMVESVALLDMLLSFVNVVALSPPDQPYTKPTITEHGNLVIKKGRHPLVERVLKDRTYIPSDTFFDPLSTFHIVTGPNCAGKSTYLRAMALITILAQMGCYVPASEATIPIRDRICTRFGTSDDMEENASSFAVEMTETAFILETCTSRSLVLIDELGRGTANDEGAAIAWSISEEMIQRGSYTCFATHYHQLNRLAQLYPRCRCYHMGTESNVNSVHFRYVLKDGPFPSTGMYGIKTAALSGLPAEVIHEAERIYEKLRSDREIADNSIDQASTTSGSSIINRNLLHHLYVLRYADLDYAGLRRQLQHLRNRFLAPVAESS